MALEGDAIPIPGTLEPANSNSSFDIHNDFYYELEKTYQSTQSLNADVDSSVRFQERTHFYTEKLEYPRHGTEPGFIFIFNQETFSERCKNRPGSTRDVNEIILCLQRLGFNIDRNKNILTDGGTEEIVAKLKELGSMNFSQYNSLMIFFLSHGHRFDFLETSDGIIRVDDIMGPFRASRTLKDKPKIFVFQACKGDEYVATGEVKPPPSPLASEIVFQDSYITPDTLIVFAAIEGTQAYRNPVLGSWFIQEMCRNFSAYGRKEDIISLFTRTTKCVCGNYYFSLDNITYRKQLPMLISTLTKKFYLNKNKDRHFLLHYTEKMHDVIDLVREIRECLTPTSSSSSSNSRAALREKLGLKDFKHVTLS
ncbi:unnamed protein product [Acanthoscelides obtectus]|uniref:Uncharacterized protein n=1 Tax=Acanthoscelides obtectus TaxID=200917 RepID=A0A9P0LPT0_ACAOB|nr:unnamed protein product [Acanthoscelides obtectus]CAK1638426.1 Caspase-3 [Acanthoscelides obtectus]